MAVFVGWAGEQIANRRANTLLDVQAGNIEAVVHSALDLNIEGLDPHARTVLRDRKAVEAVVDGDGVALAQNIIATFNRVLAKGEITHVTFYDADGSILARFPEGAPGGKQPAISANAFETRQRSQGIIELEPGIIGGALTAPVLKVRNSAGPVVPGISGSGQLQRIADLLEAEALLFGGERLPGSRKQRPSSRRPRLFSTASGAPQASSRSMAAARS